LPSFLDSFVAAGISAEVALYGLWAIAACSARDAAGGCLGIFGGVGDFRCCGLDDPFDGA
jgi:hypothetical protein